MGQDRGGVGESKPFGGVVASVLLHSALVGVLAASIGRTNGGSGSPSTVWIEIESVGEASKPAVAHRRIEPARTVSFTRKPASEPATSESVAVVSEASAPSANVSEGARVPAAGSPYVAELAGALERAKEYPALARARNQIGRVVVAFTVRKDGEIFDLRVIEAAAHELLNAAALETVRRVGRLRPVPDEIARGDWRVRIPIEFSLDR